MNGLTVGRIVHYTFQDDLGRSKNEVTPLMCHAAIITRVIDAERGIVNLQWLDDNSLHVARGVRNCDPATPVENTWHWPEQV